MRGLLGADIATFGGATFALRFGIDELSALGVTAREIVLTGGGVRSDKWRQLVADICAAPVTVYRQGEAPLLGPHYRY